MSKPTKVGGVFLGKEVISAAGSKREWAGVGGNASTPHTTVRNNSRSTPRRRLRRMKHGGVKSLRRVAELHGRGPLLAR